MRKHIKTAGLEQDVGLQEKTAKQKYTRKCGNCSCIATCSLALRSNSLELAHTLSRSPELIYIPSPSLVHLLARTRLNALELTDSFSCPLSRTRSHSLALVVGSHSLELVYFLSNSLSRCCQAIQFSLSSLMLFLK